MTERAETQWLTTEPNPRSLATGHDAGQRGWRLHSVIAKDSDTSSSIRGRQAACGIVPRWGWSLDMFVDQRCAKCERALKRAVGEEPKR